MSSYKQLVTQERQYSDYKGLSPSSSVEQFGFIGAVGTIGVADEMQMFKKIAQGDAVDIQFDGVKSVLLRKFTQTMGKDIIKQQQIG
ncbi:MAG: hypothetical protein EZS28_052254, partial [Streblomastix strix]